LEILEGGVVLPAIAWEDNVKMTTHHRGPLARTWKNRILNPADSPIINRLDGHPRVEYLGNGELYLKHLR
jgi:hypothetical protein